MGPPPVYEYLSPSRPGKENFSSKFRPERETTAVKVRSQVKSGTYPRKRKDRDTLRGHHHQQSPKSENSNNKKESSPRQNHPVSLPQPPSTSAVAGIVLSAGNGSGSGTEKDQRSSGSGKTGPR